MEVEQSELPKVVKNVIDIDKIELTLAFNRFLYLGSIQSNFIKPFVIDLKKEENNPIFTQIKIIINKLIETDPLAPLNLIKKAIQSNSLYAYDAALCCLVLCLCETKNEELQNEIRKTFAEVICTSEQLLLFIFFYSQRKNGKLNFARGMRIALARWYEKKSANELVELFHTNRKIMKIGHKNLLHMAHVKFKDDQEKKRIVQSIYKNVELSGESSVIDKKIYSYRRLKSAKNAEEVVEILKAKEFPYKLEHIPTCALKSIEVIDLILPSMSLREVLDNILIFCSHRMLKVQEPVSKKICNILQAPNKVISETKLYPIYIFQLIKELEKRLTIHHDLSATTHKNGNGNAAMENLGAANDKAKTEKKFYNPYVIKKMKHLFTQTLNEQPKTGCRFYVTVNFRKFSKRQANVYGMHEILCSELQAIIALTLLKNEKEVSVMSFSDSNAKLKKVEWTNETSYDKAIEIYSKEIEEMPKTKEVLQLPLRKAIEDKKKVDVFITFVSSLGRSLGDKGKPDHLISELQNYRRIMNLKMTKYIIINMTRRTPDLHYDDKNINEKGILEMVGFSGVSSMKVIEAFAKNSFA